MKQIPRLLEWSVTRGGPFLNRVVPGQLIDLVSTTTPEVERKEEEGVGEEDEGCCTSSVTPETLVHFSKGGLHFQFDEWCKSSWTPTARYHSN